MTYAEVVLDRPTCEPFTYRLTPEQLPMILPGSLVEVPFGRRKEFGIVSALRRRVSHRLAEKLRPVDRVLSPGVWAPAATLALARAMARYSGESLGICLFRLLPPSGKRLKAAASLAAPLPVPLTPQRLHLYGGTAYRTGQAAQLARRTLSSGRQVLMLAPAHRLSELRAALLPVGQTESLTAEVAPTLQRATAERWRAGTCQILIGTRHLAGWPAHALGLIVVDDPLHQAHTDDQRPYLDTTTLALLRSQAEASHVVLASPLPTLGMALAEARGLAHRLRAEPMPPGLRLIEQRGGAWLSPVVLDTIGAGERTVIVAPRAGLGGTLRCETCEATVRCGGCSGELELTTAPQEARCFDCGRIGPWPDACPRCHGHELRSFGVGAETLRRELVRTLGSVPPNVSVGTEQLLESPADLIVLPFADSPLASPSLGRTERYVSRIRAALSHTRRVLLLTRHPANPWWRLLGPGAPDALASLLAERRAAQLPPYVRALRVSSSAPRTLPALPDEVRAVSANRDGRAMMELLVPAYRWEQTLAALHVRDVWMSVGSLLDQL